MNWTTWQPTGIVETTKESQRKYRLKKHQKYIETRTHTNNMNLGDKFFFVMRNIYDLIFI